VRAFADTHFWIALLSERDAAHGAARRWQAAGGLRQVVTTSWVLVELANGMSRAAERETCATLIEHLRGAPAIRIIPATEQLLWRGFELYRRRPDKAWSLTDCISFVVMADEGLTEALTGDRHFEQAGYRALLA
jgi:predicted nucleic acid-binding protein